MDGQEQTTLQKCCLYLGVVAVGVSSLVVAGFMSNWGNLPLPAWIAISMVGAAVAMAGCTRPRWMAAIAGLVGGASIPLAILLYTIYRSRLSDTFARIEFLIPGLLGALPAIGLFHLLRKLFSGPGR